MDGIRTFISRNKISIIASLIVVFIGLIGVLFWEKFYKSNLIKKVEGKTYSFLYDDSWCVKKKSESLIRLEHRSSSIIKIEMVDLVGEYKYLTIDELIDEVSYRILKDNDKYKLISKMEDSFTMNRDNGYKMLYENKDKQVMVVTYKRGDKLIVISYEADSNYFDILLDSVQNIIYNFDYRDEKFALKSNIKLKLSEIEYGKGSKIEKLLEGVSSYEIFDNNYEVSFTIPNNFKLENLNTKTKNFDFEGLETGSIRLNSFIVNRNIYDYLDVHFDLWYGESHAYKQFDEMMPYLEKQGILIEDDGAKIIDVKEDGDKVELPPCMIQKSDGAYLYATSDLGTIWQRVKDFKPDEIIYVVDGRQSMYFVQVFRAANKSNIYNGVLEHHGFGTVNGADNKPFKTRSGGALKLEDLIKQVKEEFINLREENKDMDEEDVDKIVNAIIKFADLQNNLERNYIFDIKKFSGVSGKTGPYILYTYLRINKIISEYNGVLSDAIYSETDRSLRLKMLEVSEVINQASKERRPHYLADYLYDLSVVANNFYQNNKVSGLTGTQKDDFMLVLSFNNYIIETLLGLLGIKIPKAM